MRNMEWEIEITHSGMWPTKWHWSTTRTNPWGYRSGDTFTEDRARKKALAAKRSMETEDIRVVYEGT